MVVNSLERIFSKLQSSYPSSGPCPPRQDVRAAEEEVEKMAAIAEQEKMRSIGMEKQLLSLGLTPGSAPGLPATQQQQQALQERDGYDLDAHTDTHAEHTHNRMETRIINTWD